MLGRFYSLVNLLFILRGLNLVVKISQLVIYCEGITFVSEGKGGVTQNTSAHPRKGQSGIGFFVFFGI